MPIQGEAALTSVDVIVPTTVATAKAAASASSRRRARDGGGGNSADGNVSGDAGRCQRRQRCLLYAKEIWWLVGW